MCERFDTIIGIAACSSILVLPSSHLFWKCGVRDQFMQFYTAAISSEGGRREKMVSPLHPQLAIPRSRRVL